MTTPTNPGSPWSGPTWTELLAPTRLTAVVDIGANPIDGDPPYKPMMDAGLCTVTGFEPQAEALAKLLAVKGPHERYLRKAIGDGGDHELKVTWMNGMTSLFEPDVVRLSALNEFARYGEVLQRVPVSTTRLDDVEEIVDLDLLKIDVQGAELMVFRNGRRKLAGAVAVHAEVAFVPLYHDQPLFADVDAELRSQGFVPHAMAALKRWPIAPGVLGGDIFATHQQLLEADVAYVKDFAHLELLDDEQLRHLALLAHHVYSSPDLVVRCLVELLDRAHVDPDVVPAYGGELGVELTTNGVRSDR
ncbi:MAG: FkbM family methyltransferase [Janthinobacterium lividum]